MAYASHLSNQDDSGDVLMGLQELDSHLALFDETTAPNNASRDSSPLSDHSAQFWDSLQHPPNTGHEEAHDHQTSSAVEDIPATSGHVAEPRREAKAYKYGLLLTH